MASQSMLKVADPTAFALPSGGTTPYNEQSDPLVSFHPQFSSEDADIVLQSQDGTSFRVHSLILKLASGWFKTAFQLPQGEATSPTLEPIVMQESSEVLAIILSMASSQPFPRITKMGLLESLVQAAEKYDMAGVLSILRLVILSPIFLDNHPIRVYAIACRWGWTEEAKVASSHTITLDLLSPELFPDIRSVDSADLTRLMLLHRRRRVLFKEGLDCMELFYANVIPGKCSGCQMGTPHDKWHRMKYNWVTATELRPTDTTSRSLLERSELQDVLDATCARCQKKLYNAETTIANLRSVLDGLPKTIEPEDPVPS